LRGFSLSRRTVFPILAMGLFAVAGCRGRADESGEADMPAAAQPMSAEVQELVNQGNEAQRAGNYASALGLYREAMELAADHPVPQFGALMAAMALGEQALADSLTRKLEATSPELLAMLSPDGSMGGGMPANPHAGGMPGMAPPESATDQVEGLPAGHPVLYEVTPDTVPPDTSGIR
jgi:hypothetical protein